MGPLEVLIIVVVVWIVPSFAVGKLAQRRDHDFWPMFLLSLVVSWLIGLVIVLVGEEGEPPPPSPADRVEPGTRAR